MKIIGKAGDSYDSTWIATVTTSELQQANEKYYGAGSDEFAKSIKVGAEIHLGQIPAQRARIEEAAKALGSAQQALQKAMPDLMGLALALAKAKVNDDLVASLEELLNLCVIGDVDETTEAHGWGDAIKRAKAAVAQAKGGAA